MPADVCCVFSLVGLFKECPSCELESLEICEICGLAMMQAVPGEARVIPAQWPGAQPSLAGAGTGV